MRDNNLTGERTVHNFFVTFLPFVLLYSILILNKNSVFSANNIFQVIPQDKVQLYRDCHLMVHVFQPMFLENFIQTSSYRNEVVWSWTILLVLNFLFPYITLSSNIEGYSSQKHPDLLSTFFLTRNQKIVNSEF